jgi:hypothetical protein
MDKLTLENKELKILRNAIDGAGYAISKKQAQSDDIKKIIDILENFLRLHKTLCYGGTAINNILPQEFRFYNRNVEIPDYDFFTPNALDYAIKLTNIYYDAGYTEVEAKSGIHQGTYKVFVNFIPIADITYLDKKLFDNLFKKAIKINAINYCPPNFLRMAMYLELSRPMGDVNRWEKILKRLILLNKNFHLKGKDCDNINFQRKYEGNIIERNKIYNLAKISFINQGLVFFGGFATSLYSKYMHKNEKINIKNIPDFDIISKDPYTSALILKEQLNYEGFKNIKISKKNPIGEYIDTHYEISVNKDVIAIIYKALACHSYNTILLNNHKVKIATIDTILSFYLIFIYSNRPYHDVNRLLCMSEYLFKVQLRNRLEQKGLLKRFSISCYGKQKSIEDIRSEKASIFRELKNNNVKKGSPSYNKYFLRYLPSEERKTKLQKTKSNIKKTKSKTKKI